jgi:hypothetical protein
LIFLSHSRLDRETIRSLKQLLEERFLHTIEVFFCEDPESIEKGSDWFATLRSALQRTELMFCFFSPSSIDPSHSRWIYYEAGFVAGINQERQLFREAFKAVGVDDRTIHVVPVAINGLLKEAITIVQKGDLPSPFDQSQAIELHEASGLHELMERANRLVQGTFQLEASPDDFWRIFPMQWEPYLSGIEVVVESCDVQKAASLLGQSEIRSQRSYPWKDEQGNIALTCDFRDAQCSTLRISVSGCPTCKKFADFDRFLSQLGYTGNRRIECAFKNGVALESEKWADKLSTNRSPCKPAGSEFELGPTRFWTVAVPLNRQICFRTSQTLEGFSNDFLRVLAELRRCGILKEPARR